MAGPVWSAKIHKEDFVKQLRGDFDEENGDVVVKVYDDSSAGFSKDACSKADQANATALEPSKNVNESTSKKVNGGVMTEKLSKLKTRARIEGMLAMVGEELQEEPLYYDSDHLCSVLHCTCISFIVFRCCNSMY